MKVLITGGAGFIGVNCATYFADKGHEVVMFDNLSRIGSEKNLKWVKSRCSVEFVKGDLRNFEATWLSQSCKYSETGKTFES